MSRYMECDVCGLKGADEHWIEALIPASFLGELGDEELHVDICSLQCLRDLGDASVVQEVQEEEQVPAQQWPQPAEIEPDTAAMTAEVYKDIKEAASGKRRLRPIPKAEAPTPTNTPGRYLSPEEIEMITGVQKRW